METTYKAIDNKIEVTQPTIKSYSLKELKDKKEELKFRKAYFIAKENEAQAEIDAIQILIDQCKILKIIE